MKAIVHQYKAGFEGVEYKVLPEITPDAGEVKVKLKSAGLNHRDLFIMNNRKEMQLPLVLWDQMVLVLLRKLEKVFQVLYYKARLL